MKKKILLFSTLNPYPFWAGSENFWFDFVGDQRVNSRFDFQVVLADSPTTRAKAEMLAKQGVRTEFYKHFNIDFARRNFYRLADRLRKNQMRTLPWYDRIKSEERDLVWFCVSTLQELIDLDYPVSICKKLKIPYWLIVQHGTEDFFLTSEKEVQAVSEIAALAKSFIFIAKRNQLALERAIGQRLGNVFHSVNAVSNNFIQKAEEACKSNPVNASPTAKFFNLGRFAFKDKAQHLLLEAFADKYWENKNWQLSFIGLSEFGKFYIRKLTDFYGLNREKIKVLPHTKDILAEIVKNDVLLMPSLAEGTPFAMVESMACGRPALGTPTGGIPELVIENQTGWLARTTDVSDIGDKLKQVWRERDQWMEFGRNAQKNIQANYNQEKSIAELLVRLTEDTNM